MYHENACYNNLACLACKCAKNLELKSNFIPSWDSLILFKTSTHVIYFKKVSEQFTDKKALYVTADTSVTKVKSWVNSPIIPHLLQMWSIQNFHSLAAIKHKKWWNEFWVVQPYLTTQLFSFTLNILQKSDWRDQVGINWSKLEL